MGPRDAIGRLAVPVDVFTGEPLTDAQFTRIAQLRGLHRDLMNLMHDCEGSSVDNEGFQSRRMAIAATQIEMGMLMAIKAALEVK